MAGYKEHLAIFLFVVNDNLTIPVKMSFNY